MTFDWTKHSPTAWAYDSDDLCARDGAFAVNIYHSSRELRDKEKKR